MCEPVSISAGSVMMYAAIAAVVASAASAGLSVYSQQQQQKAQLSYQTKLQAANAEQMQQNRDLATKAYLDQATATNRQLAESREATAAANFDQSRKAMELRGAAIAEASEAGVYGVSLTSLLSDFNRQEDMFKTRNDQNLIMKQQQNATQVRAYESEAYARSAQIKPYIPTPVAPVDYVGPALQVVQTGANTYMNYKAATSKATN